MTVITVMCLRMSHEHVRLLESHCMHGCKENRLRLRHHDRLGSPFRCNRAEDMKLHAGCQFFGVGAHHVFRARCKVQGQCIKDVSIPASPR